MSGGGCPHSTNASASPLTCSRCILLARNAVGDDPDAVTPQLVYVRQVVVIDGWIHVDGVNVGRHADGLARMEEAERQYAGGTSHLQFSGKKWCIRCLRLGHDVPDCKEERRVDIEPKPE